MTQKIHTLTLQAMFKYDHHLDEYVEVEFDEFTDDEDQEEELNPTDTVRSLNPLLVLRKQRIKRKRRSSFVNYFYLSRIVRKSGRLNTFLTQLSNKHVSYIRDLGNTLLTIRWRWILFTLFAANIACFVMFSGLWMFLAKVSGDFDEPFNKTDTPCIVNANTFVGYLLLSIETMTTIGYGYRYPTEHCTGGWMLLTLQSIFNICVQGALVSAVYVKTSKPFTTLSLFSKKAVVSFLVTLQISPVERVQKYLSSGYCQNKISYLLLSIETMTTIGYGYRYPTEHCTGGWMLLTLQSIFNICVQGALVSAVYVKTSKPFTTLSLFSKKAVVCLRDGKLCFIFRIHDFSKKIWCGTHISLYFIDKEQTKLEADFEMQQLTIEPHGLLIFPLEIEHVIDEDSPLWKFRPFEFLHARYEIVAVAEGSSTITGQVSQNRTSYQNSDIMWGHRFLPCVDYDDTRRTHVVDYKKFKQVIPFDTPLCSARKLAEMQERLTAYFQNNPNMETSEGRLSTIEEDQTDENRAVINVKSKEERIPDVFRKLFHIESVHDFTNYKS